MTGCRFAITRQRNVIEPPHTFWHVTLHEVTMQQGLQSGMKLMLQQFEINCRCVSSHKVRHLAIDTTPITGIVRVQIDTQRYPACPSRYHGIHISQAGNITAMIIDIQCFSYQLNRFSHSLPILPCLPPKTATESR